LNEYFFIINNFFVQASIKDVHMDDNQDCVLLVPTQSGLLYPAEMDMGKLRRQLVSFGKKKKEGDILCIHLFSRPVL